MTDPIVEGDAEADAAEAQTPPEPFRLYGELAVEGRDLPTLHVERERFAEVIRRLRDDEDFNLCLDITAVDYLTYEARRPLPEGVTAERFEVVATLLSMAHRCRVRIKTQVPVDDPSVPSLFDVHPGMEASEREVYDMFGIRFDGHPDLTRILMPEDWEGHPLRKDFSIGSIPVQFKYPVNER